MNKFNKQVLLASICAICGINTVKAESEIMNHRIVAKVGGNWTHTNFENSFKKLSAKDGGNVKSENFKWALGGGLEYDYFFTPLIGVSVDTCFGYQKLDAFKGVINENSVPADGQDNKKDEKTGKTLDFGGLFVNADLGCILNFIEDGVIFDEEEGCTAGLKAGLKVKGCLDFNFGKVDYSKTDISDDDKKPQLNLFRYGVEGDTFVEFPFGFGLEVGYRGTFGDMLKSEKKEDNTTNPGNGEKNKDKKDNFKGSVNLNLFYNFANLLF